jgi:hypothetical protein
LAEASEREVIATPASAHVRVIEDQTDARDADLEAEELEAPVADSFHARTGGFHVRAIPIDQPFGE